MSHASALGPEGDVWMAFLGILLEGAPYLLLGTVISGLIDAFLPRGLLEKFLPRQRVPALMIAGLLGLVLPVCECAVVPIIRRLLAKGLPLSCGLTYMLAAPIVNPIVAVSTWSAFQGQDPWWMVGSRLGLGYLVAVSCGWIVGRLPVKKVLLENVVSPLGFAERGFQRLSDRLSHAATMAMHDFINTGKYFVVGVLIAALFNTQVLVQPSVQEAVINYGAMDAIAIPGMMLMALLLSLCSTTDAFIAASTQGVALSGKMAFLVFGPMMDLKLLVLYATIFQRGFVARLAIGLFGLVGMITYIWSWR